MNSAFKYRSFFALKRRFFGVQPEASKYTETIHLPVTSFPQRSNFKQEKEIQKWWAECRIYERILDQNNGGTFYLHDGPPFANGKLHMGHAVNKILKDIINRYMLLKGEKARFIPGWDCHGLPIELKVQQEMQTATDSLSPSVLRSTAKSFALSAVNDQMVSFQRFGVWALWDKAYLTLQPAYEAAQIDVFKKMFANGLVYRKLKPVHWSPSSLSALAESEIEYNDNHISQSIYFGVEVFPPHSQSCFSGANLLVWTTTPWTIPANKAMAVNPTVRYSVVSHPNVLDGRSIIVASDCLPSLSEMLGGNFVLKQEISGGELVGVNYRHPLSNEILHVLAAEASVIANSGTGIVHIAPGHGAEDYSIGVKHGLPIFSPVDGTGKFTEQAGDRLFGLDVLTTGSTEVIKLLHDLHLVWKEVAFKHKYPYDWRTKKPTIFRATQQWFISLEALRDKAMDEIEKVHWLPDSGKSRISAMTSSRDEWCISRQRSWGVPIPVFYNKQTGSPLITEETIAHVKSVFERDGSDAWWELDIAELLPSKLREHASDYVKGFDTLDVWFDSGTSWTVISRDISEATKFPADLYLEGSDQSRGWFQSSLLTSVATNGTAPYKTVLTHGFVLDEKGRKMSKSIGNILDPIALIEGEEGKAGIGSDALRLWVASVDFTADMCVGHNFIKPSADSCKKIRNTLRFILGCLHDFHITDAIPYDELPNVDKHILGCLSKLVFDSKIAYEQYQFNKIHQAIMHFVTVDLSAFYLEIGKDRLYIPKINSFPRRSFQTTVNVIFHSLLTVFSPILPHLGEEIWMHFSCANDKKKLSVFQSGWPSQNFPAHQSEQWSMLRELRGYTNKCLEKSRKEKLIGSSLEAELTLMPKSDEYSKLLMNFSTPDADADSLEKLLLVSKVIVMSQKNERSNDCDQEHWPLEVKLRRHSGFKCQRCWVYSDTVGKNSLLSDLCERCVHSL
jgi:isoleucyl-tRNA synthetase